MNDTVSVIGGADAPTGIFLVPDPRSVTLFAVLGCAAALLLLYLLLYRRFRARAFCCVLSALLILGADRAVKLAVQTLSLGETAALLPPLLQLQRVHNYGAAWSSFSGMRWLLVAVTAVGIGALCYLLARVVRHPLGVWALTAVIAGGVGNLIDRVWYGYVVDMFDCLFLDFPVFNVADIFVVLGTVGAAVYYLAFYEKADAKNWGKRDGTDPAAPDGN